MHTYVRTCTVGLYSTISQYVCSSVSISTLYVTVQTVILFVMKYRYKNIIVTVFKPIRQGGRVVKAMDC